MPFSHISYKKREPFFSNDSHGIRRRPTLPGRFQPSTISVLRLNFCVRDGNRWIPQAIVTGNSLCERPLLPPFCYRRFGHTTASRLPLSGYTKGFALSRFSHPQNRTGLGSAPSDQDLASTFETSLCSFFPNPLALWCVSALSGVSQLHSPLSTLHSLQIKPSTD